MKKFLIKSFGFFVFGVMIPVVSAGVFEECTPCEVVSCNPETVCNTKSLWDFGGWLDAGVMANGYGQKDEYTNGVLDPDSGNTGHLKNAKHASFQINQAWLFLGKRLNQRGFDIGGRVDFMYGVDGQHFQAAGLGYEPGTGKRWGEGDYYAALPQLYAEVGYKNLSVKVGKFFTPMGLDSSCSPNRFFYTTSYENQSYIDFGGVLATWALNKNGAIFGGWVNGEGNFFDGNNRNAFLGGVSYKVGSRVQVDYSALIGKDEAVRQYFVNSLVARINLNQSWNYAIAWLLRNEKSDLVPNLHFGRYGVNQEIFYKLNSRWTVGARAEWMKDYSNARGYDFDVYAFTLGVNWKPTAFLTIRPEVRYDNFSGEKPFNRTKSKGLDLKDDQFLYGFSGYIQF
ncbi:MAG: porin [Planctomycetaceae bacterium]|jgi:hypothetical protein|nr:porin [Planctomycetaceae bacterium]